MRAAQSTTPADDSSSKSFQWQERNVHPHPSSAKVVLQVEPQCTAHITPGGNVRIELKREAVSGSSATAERDPVQLAIFSHRCANLLNSRYSSWSRVSAMYNAPKSALGFGRCCRVLRCAPIRPASSSCQVIGRLVLTIKTVNNLNPAGSWAWRRRWGARFSAPASA